MQTALQSWWRYVGACALSTLLFVSAVHAQDSAQVITLERAIAVALEQNVDLQQAENQVDYAEVGVFNQRMQFLPDLSVSSTLRRSFGRTFNQNELQIVDQVNDSWSAGLSSRINLFNGFSDVASYEQAKLEERSASHTFDRRKEAVVFQVLSSYLDVIQARERVEILTENLAARQAQLERVQALVEAGARPDADLFRQEADVADAEYQLLQAEQQVRTFSTRLVNILHLDPFEAYTFTAPQLDAAEAPVAVTMEGVLRTAFENRADLQAQLASIRAAAAGIDAAQGGWWPRLDLALSYGSAYTSISPLSLHDQFVDRNRNGAVGLSISLPIFDRLQTHANVQRAQITYANAELQLEGLRQDVATEVREAVEAYDAAIKQREVAQKRLVAARRALEAEEARYEAGSATQVDLSQARASFVDAQSQLVQARYNVLFRDRLLDYYQGTLAVETARF